MKPKTFYHNIHHKESRICLGWHFSVPSKVVVMYCFTVSFVESQWSNGTGGDAENFSCEHWRDKARGQGRENISLSIWGDHWVDSTWLFPKIWRNPLRMRPQRKIVRTHALLFCKVVEAFFCNGSAEECASCKTLGGFLLKAPLHPAFT